MNKTKFFNQQFNDINIFSAKIIFRSPNDVCAICTFYGCEKLLVGFTIDCSIFEFTLLNHCACQSANSHIERNHFGKCFFLETITF